jgi:hypothetical protein
MMWQGENRTMKRPIFKNIQFDAQYFEKGFVKTPMLAKQEVEFLLQEISKLNPDDGFAPDRVGVSKYHCTFLDTNEDYKRATNRLFKSTFNPIVNSLFHNYHVWNANLYVKPPGTGKFEIHQNWTHVAKEEDTSFTIWCPLVDTNEENGTISLVEGSHKILPDIATMSVPYYFKNFENRLIENHLKPIPCEAGDAVIFEDGVIHYSAENKSNKPRYALQILIGPKNVSPAYYYFNQEKPELGFEVFELDEEFFMTSNYTTFHNRPKGQVSKGFVKNNNKLVTQEEFIIALKKGKSRRKSIYG